MLTSEDATGGGPHGRRADDERRRNGTPAANGDAATETETATAAKATADSARVEEMVSRSLAQTRDWINRKRLAPEILPASPRLSTRDWLVAPASRCSRWW